MNPLLVQASRQHSQDMFARNYFAHVTPDGNGPSQRVAAAGLTASGVAESIAYSYQSGYPVTNETSFQVQKATATLSDLIVDSGVPDLGHRKMLLDAGGQLQAFHQAGVGIDLEGPQPGQTWTDLTTIDMASTSDTRALLTGVVYNDAAANGLYQPGEGLTGVRIAVANAGTTTTDASGGYSLPLRPASTRSPPAGVGLSLPIVRTVAIGKINQLLDFDASPNGLTQAAAVSTAFSGSLGTFPALHKGDTDGFLQCGDRLGR